MGHILCEHRWLPVDRHPMGPDKSFPVKSMKQMRQIMTKFQERNGATQCKLLKGVGTKVMLRACPDCVADAAEFLEEELDQLNQNK